MMNEKQYIGKIQRQLRCKTSRKKEIIRQIQSDIAIALENGDDFESIMQKMGSPAEVAAEFNENMSDSDLRAAKREKIFKRIGIVCAILLILSGLTYWALPKVSDIKDSRIFSEKEVIEKSKQVVSYLDEDDLAALQPLMTKEMQGVLTETVLSDVKKQLSGDFGEFQSYGNIYLLEISQRGQHAVIAEVSVSYENASVTYQLSFDENMMLSGLYMR